jgi:hypothetical protein
VLGVVVEPFLRIVVGKTAKVCQVTRLVCYQEEGEGERERKRKRGFVIGRLILSSRGVVGVDIVRVVFVPFLARVGKGF